MDSHHIDWDIEAIERGLRIEDPDLDRRLRQMWRREAQRVTAVVALLAASLILLTVGLATLSASAWVAGVTAFLAAFAVDRLLDGTVRLRGVRIGHGHHDAGAATGEAAPAGTATWGPRPDRTASGDGRSPRPRARCESGDPPSSACDRAAR